MQTGSFSVDWSSTKAHSSCFSKLTLKTLAGLGSEMAHALCGLSTGNLDAGTEWVNIAWYLMMVVTTKRGWKQDYKNWMLFFNQRWSEMLLFFLGFINENPQVNTTTSRASLLPRCCGTVSLHRTGTDTLIHARAWTGDKPKLRLRLTWTLAHIQICTLYSILYITERQSRKDIASSRTSHHTTDLPPKRSFTAKCRSIHSYWDNSEVAAWHFYSHNFLGTARRVAERVERILHTTV